MALRGRPAGSKNKIKENTLDAMLREDKGEKKRTERTEEKEGTMQELMQILKGEWLSMFREEIGSLKKEMKEERKEWEQMIRRMEKRKRGFTGESRETGMGKRKKGQRREEKEHNNQRV